MSVESSFRFPDAPEYECLFNACTGLYLVLDPDFRIVAVTDSYLQATKTERQAILGSSRILVGGLRKHTAVRYDGGHEPIKGTLSVVAGSG